MPGEDTGFNPRARVGRDGHNWHVVQQVERFNPRARVGRDYICNTFVHLSECFNPRARVGRDRSRTLYELAHGVSIHAPAWGAT